MPRPTPRAQAATPVLPASSASDLGYFLVHRGWITPEQLREAREHRRLAGGTLGTALLEAGTLTETRLLEGLSEVLDVPVASAEDLHGAPRSAYNQLPAKVAQRARAVPFRVVGGELWVAMQDVSDLTARDEISAVTGRRLRPHAATEVRIAEALQTFYGQPCSDRLSRLLERLNQPPALWDDGLPRPLNVVPLTPNERDALTRAARRARSAEEGPSTAAQQAEVAEAEAEVAASPRFEAARRRLEAARELGEIGDALLDALAERFHRAVVLKVRPSEVVGWKGRGAGMAYRRLTGFAASFEEPSIFLNLRQGSGFHLGPLAPMPIHHELAHCWGGELPTQAVAVPVRVRGRMVAILYGDRGDEPLTGIDVAELRQLAAAGADAFELYLIQKKQRKA